MSLEKEEEVASCSHPCGGACCRAFTLLGFFGEAANRAAKVAEVREWKESGGALEPWMEDLLTVDEMLIPLEERSGEGLPLFGCKHLEEPSGRCGIYATRPGMCRRYPAGEPARTCRSCGFTAPS